MCAQVQYFNLLGFLFDDLHDINKLVLLVVNLPKGKSIVLFLCTQDTFITIRLIFLFKMNLRFYYIFLQLLLKRQFLFQFVKSRYLYKYEFISICHFVNCTCF